MAYIMTNGIYYIFMQGKSVKKVLDVGKATVFPTYDDAVKTISKHQRKCKSYRIYDVTDLASAECERAKETIKKNIHAERTLNHL